MSERGVFLRSGVKKYWLAVAFFGLLGLGFFWWNQEPPYECNITPQSVFEVCRFESHTDRSVLLLSYHKNYKNAIVYSIKNPKSLFKNKEFNYYGKYAEKINSIKDCPLYSKNINENYWDIYSYDDDC